ncbi:MAG: right-handed parallel beta-helix repeat-containing protein [Armatimonadetes bacterium]|nr:right-handed parallel beta-helix repeat-containing protein [Akkermansiaceae bacterium]
MKTSRLALIPLLAAIASAQGPLQPPSVFNPAIGPIAPLTGGGLPQPAMKTLHQVEPRIPINATTTPGNAASLFRITQPGSYYLTENITGVNANHGILIAASGVTLDLMGYSLRGVAGSGSGIYGQDGTRNIAIKNGIVTNWAGDGIGLALPGSNIVVENLLVEGSSGRGIVVPATSIVRNCQVRTSVQGGILTSLSCVVTGCTLELNSAFGISSFGLISDCVALNNSAVGINCMEGIVRNCKVTQITGTAFAGGTGSVSFEACHASCIGVAASFGFSLSGNGSRVSDSSTFNFNTGITTLVETISSLVISNCIITKSILTGMSLISTDSTATGGHQVIGCTVDGVSSGPGILLDSKGLMRDCLVRSTSSDGLRVRSNSRILNNVFISNGGSTEDGSIFLGNPVSNVLISGNSIHNAVGWGILGSSSTRVTVTGNTFFQSAGGNNISLAGSNIIGPVVTSANIGTTTNPWANFSQ